MARVVIRWMHQANQKVARRPRKGGGRHRQLPLQVGGGLGATLGVPLNQREYVLGGAPLEWRPTCEHLMQENAQTPPVGCSRPPTARDSLRRGILVRAALREGAGLGDVFGKAKVAQLRPVGLS